MAWPDEVQYAKDSNGNVIGLVTGAGKTAYLENIVASSYVPVGLVGLNGTTDAVDSGGILTCQAMPRTYSEGWVRLPAGMVSGRGAGYHYFVALGSPVSTSVQLKDLFVADGSVFVPYIPDTTPANAVGTATAVAQTTATQINLTRMVVEGGLLGSNGFLRVVFNSSANPSAVNKIIRAFYDTATVCAFLHNNSGIVNVNMDRRLWNRGKETAQINDISSNFPYQGTAGDVALFAIDSTVDKFFKITAQIPATTDSLFLEGSRISTNFM